MNELKRLAARVLPLLVVIAGALGCCEVVAWCPDPRVLQEAARPIPQLTGEQRGPTLEQAIEYFNQLGPEWASPPDVVE